MKNFLIFLKEGDREFVLIFNERDSKFMFRDKKEIERKKKKILICLKLGGWDLFGCCEDFLILRCFDLLIIFKFVVDLVILGDLYIFYIGWLEVDKLL